MKEHSGILNTRIYHRPASYGGRLQQFFIFLQNIRRPLQTLWPWISTGLSIIIFAALFLGVIYLFFIQLARYGW